MTATITSDASFYGAYKIGAYAFWITTSIKRILKAGALKGDVHSSNEAEFKSIINGLHALHSAKFGTLKTVYINTDCKYVIDVIKNGESKQCAELLKAYQAIVTKLNVTIILRHVKGHLHTKTPRHFVNDWCDKTAKIYAKREIKKRFGVTKK